MVDNNELRKNTKIKAVDIIKGNRGKIQHTKLGAMLSQFNGFSMSKNMEIIHELELAEFIVIREGIVSLSKKKA